MRASGTGARALKSLSGRLAFETRRWIKGAAPSWGEVPRAGEVCVVVSVA